MRHASVSEALSGLDSLGKIWRNRRVFAGVFLGTVSYTHLTLPTTERV